jgi:hypothetical protein
MTTITVTAPWVQLADSNFGTVWAPAFVQDYPGTTWIDLSGYSVPQIATGGAIGSILST